MPAWCNPRVILALALAVSGALGQSAPTWANECQTDATHGRIREGNLDHRIVPALITPIGAGDQAFRWEERNGRLELAGGATIVSRDSALFELERYFPVTSTGRTRSGASITFAPILPGDPRILEIRLATTPEANGAESNLLERVPRPASGPWIRGYEFQMAELMGSNYLGLWRRSGASGPETILAHFPATPGLGATIVATSERRYSLLSVASTVHGNAWSFTLFTEAARGEPLHMLNYMWWPGYPPRSSEGR